MLVLPDFLVFRGARSGLSGPSSTACLLCNRSSSMLMLVGLVSYGANLTCIAARPGR